MHVLACINTCLYYIFDLKIVKVGDYLRKIKQCCILWFVDRCCTSIVDGNNRNWEDLWGRYADLQLYLNPPSSL